MPRQRSSKVLLSFLRTLLVWAAIPALAACDAADSGKKADDKKAPAEKSDDDKAVEARLAAKKAARAEEEKAAADKVTAIKALAALPEKMPKDLAAACKGVASAQDEFMKKHYEGEGLARWEEAKGTQMGMLETGCAKAASIEIAACQINAMGTAPAEFKKDLPDILSACIEKFGAGAANPAAPPG